MQASARCGKGGSSILPMPGRAARTDSGPVPSSDYLESSVRTVCRAAARAIVVALLIVGCSTWRSSPASADDGSLLVDVPGDGMGFTHHPGVPLFDVQRLYPGSSGDGTMDVRNTSAYDARLDLSATNLDSRENSCVGPEARDPGEDCRASGGELPGWLDVTVTREDVSPAEVLWSGNLDALADGATLSADLPAGATWRLRTTVALPWEAPNDTMTDSVSFDTRLTATSDASSSTVAGPQVSTTAGGKPRGGHPITLPLTGGSVSLWWLLLDGAVLLAGAALVSVSRLGRWSPPAAALRCGDRLEL